MSNVGQLFNTAAGAVAVALAWVATRKSPVAVPVFIDSRKAAAK